MGADCLETFPRSTLDIGGQTENVYLLGGLPLQRGFAPDIKPCPALDTLCDTCLILGVLPQNVSSKGSKDEGWFAKPDEAGHPAGRLSQRGSGGCMKL